MVAITITRTDLTAAEHRYVRQDFWLARGFRIHTHSGASDKTGAVHFRLGAALRAPAGKATLADDMGSDRRDLDLVVFADQFHRGV